MENFGALVILGVVLASFAVSIYGVLYGDKKAESEKGKK